jgi:hypothetical protein
MINGAQNEARIQMRPGSILSDEVSAVAPDDATASERRRPGRIEEVSSALVPLLRSEDLKNSRFLDAPRSDLDSARGLIVGIATGLVLWMLGLSLCYMIYLVIPR